MKKQTITIIFLAITLFFLLATIVPAADKFPARPVDIVVPWGIGGGLDRMSRIAAPLLEKNLGVSCPVMNVTGGKGMAGLIKINSMPADGHAMACITSGMVMQDVLGKAKLHIKDFQPICRVQMVPNFFWVHTDSPIKTVQDLINEAKKRKVTIALAINYSTEDLDIQTFNKFFKTRLKSVSYPKFGKKIAAVLGKHVEVLLEQAGDMQNYTKQNMVRPIVFLGPKRMKTFPDVPCTGELGLSESWPTNRTWILKRDTPPERVKRLEEAWKKANYTKAFQEFLKKEYIEDSWAGSKEMENIIHQRYKDLSKAAGKIGWLK